MAYTLPPSVKGGHKGYHGHKGHHGYRPKYYGYSTPRRYGYGYGYPYPFSYLPYAYPPLYYDNCPLNTQTICDYYNPANCVCIPF